MKVIKAVIPCAGLGTRFLPATKAQPKEMLPVFDKPAIQYVVEEALSAGIKDVLIVTGRGKQAIENHFDNSFELEHFLRRHGQNKLLAEIERIGRMVNIHYVRQKEPRGLGNAISCAETFVGTDPFAVFLADDIIYSNKPAIKTLSEIYEKYDRPVIAVEEVPGDRISSYGIIKAKKISASVYEVLDIVEKPRPEKTPSNLGVIGRYILTPEIMPALKKMLPGRLGEIQLTDAIRVLNKNRHFYAVKVHGTRYDIGTKLGYIQATLEVALRKKDVSAQLKVYLKKFLRR